jgi:hypothetical protein
VPPVPQVQPVQLHQQAQQVRRARQRRVPERLAVPSWQEQGQGQVRVQRAFGRKQ